MHLSGRMRRRTVLRLPRFLQWKNWPLWVRVVFLLVCLAPVLWVMAGPYQRSIRASLVASTLDGVSPLLSFSVGIKHAIPAAWDKLRTLLHLEEDYRRLREDYAALAHELSDYSFIVEENRRLRDVLRMSPALDRPSRTVSVLGQLAGPYQQLLFLDAGLGAGLGEGQVIVNDLGLVGRVLHVGDRFSQAAALTHPSSRIPVVFIESRERAVVAGTGQSLLNVLYLSENHRIREGEWAYTSGDDRLLPAGILVGQVVMEAGQPLRLRPSVQWSKLDYVKVFLAP